MPQLSLFTHIELFKLRNFRTTFTEKYEGLEKKIIYWPYSWRRCVFFHINDTIRKILKSDENHQNIKNRCCYLFPDVCYMLSTTCLLLSATCFLVSVSRCLLSADCVMLLVGFILFILFQFSASSCSRSVARFLPVSFGFQTTAAPSQLSVKKALVTRRK